MLQGEGNARQLAEVSSASCGTVPFQQRTTTTSAATAAAAASEAAALAENEKADAARAAIAIQHRDYAARNFGARDYTTDRYTPPSAPSYSGSSGGTVSVRGYYRKDGTYVRPHTRSR